MPATELVLDNKAYVILPKSEFARLLKLAEADAARATDREIGSALRAARKRQGLTQAQLGKKLGGSTQSMISQVETGRANVTAGYVERFLEACGLWKTWKPHGWTKSLLALAERRDEEEP
jgi:ribosome-binding protein aMBF1 (putative translation factor)